MRLARPWKRPEDEYLHAHDFITWPLQTGETLVMSNARGNLSVVVEDAEGIDVTAQLVEGSPQISGDGTRVLITLIGGTAGLTYWIVIVAPTSEGELLSDRFPLEVRTHYDG